MPRQDREGVFQMNENIIIVVTCAIGIFLINMLIKQYSKANRKEELDQKIYAMVNRKARGYYYETCTEAGMPDSPLNTDHHNFWFSDDALCFVEDKETYVSQYTVNSTTLYPINITEIPIDSIQCYTKEGDIQYTAHVSGGGGGGSSLGGAIIGGVLGGDAGAVIGSRRKVAPIKTETQTHDSRQTVLRYYDDFDKLRALSFKGFTLYNFLLNTIPEKDLTTMQLGGR